MPSPISPGLVASNSPLSSSLTFTVPKASKTTQTILPPVNSGPRLYTSAQVAGISVGSSIGALLLIFALLLLWNYRKRSRSEPPKGLESDPHGLIPGTTAMISPRLTRQDSNETPLPDLWSQLRLSQPVFEDEVNYQALVLKTAITQHVYQYYKTMLSKDIKRAELSTGLSENELETMMNQQRQQKQVIRQYLAQQLLASLSPVCEPELALLPTKCVELLRSGNPPGTETSGKSLVSIYLYIVESQSDEDRLWWSSLWGALTAILLQVPEQPLEEEIMPVVRQIAQKIDKAFPCNLPDHDIEDRNQSLTYLANRAAKLGTTLFSHINAYDFQWRLGNEMSGPSVGIEQSQLPSHIRLVVFPSLYRRRLESDGSFGKSVLIYEAEVEEVNA